MSKILPEDMEELYGIINRYSACPNEYKERDIQFALRLTDIWDRGYEQAMADYEEVNKGGL